MNQRSLEFRDVTFGYSRSMPFLTQVSLRLGPGLTLLVGSNGSGKSTLLKLLAGVEKPDSGSAHINGFDLWSDEVAARHELAYLPEQPDLTPYASVMEILRLVCRLRGQPISSAEDALREVGLEDLGARSIRQLSKGQRRRAVLAAAHIGSPTVLLLDEPLDAMDRGMRERILKWIEGVCRSAGLVVVVTHELEPFVDMVTRVIAVDRGRVRVIDELPPSSVERAAMLERLARGATL